MDINAIVYTSATGFTARYAALLAERGIPAVITAYSQEEQGGLSWFK